MRAATYSFLILFLSGTLFQLPGGTAKEEFPVPPPPLSEGIFPCSACHEGMPVNPTKRELKDAHTDIKLHHAEGVRWCLDCHDPTNRDKLKLTSGELVDFGESYLLCRQCHGPIYRDWTAGIHGKRTGYFDGKRTYLLCVHCHNPHDPKFNPIKPEPPPYRPRDRHNVR
ncbi:MAG: hypothetical protein A4E65_03761 [Syntrophorhabdus sp. PtaU1.Bin153]|nr:MAG: hypothetical protein A4E65_03761 [Syntrophorhabdus sp. PtaU1.Bin153]